jgi:hypothetical protein
VKAHVLYPSTERKKKLFKMDLNIMDIKVTELPIIVMDSVDEKWKTVPVNKR